MWADIERRCGAKGAQRDIWLDVFEGQGLFVSRIALRLNWSHGFGVVAVHFRLGALISRALVRASFDKSITTIRGILRKINALMTSLVPSGDQQSCLPLLPFSRLARESRWLFSFPSSFWSKRHYLRRIRLPHHNHIFRLIRFRLIRLPRALYRISGH